MDQRMGRIDCRAVNNRAPAERSAVKTDDRYHWQEECLTIWEQNDCRGIVQAVTGAGKTMLAVKAMEKLWQVCGNELWVAVVVPTRALMVQWSRILRFRFWERDALEGPVYQIYVINSARYQLARRILAKLREGNTVFLVADECHRYTSVENRKIFEFVSYVEKTSGRYCSLGLSATLEDKDSTEMLEAALGRKIFCYSYQKALQEGIIVVFTLSQIALHFQRDEQAAYQELSDRMKTLRRQLYFRYPLLKKGGVSFFAVLQTLAKEENTTGRLAKSYLHLSWQRKRLVCMARNRLFCVCDLLGGLDAGKRVLIFSESIEQAETLYTMLKDNYGNRVGKYHSKAGKQANENALERFRNGELSILIACRALDEGIDVPDAEVGIILSGTGMERQRIQRLGRILRRSERKEKAVLYYLFIEESTEEKSYFPLRREYFNIENWEYQRRLVRKS